MSTDWLTDGGAEARDDQRAKALAFAQNYLVFREDPRARALLENWVKAVEEKDVPADSSHAVYAFAEGRRQFIRGIERQINFALTEGKGTP